MKRKFALLLLVLSVLVSLAAPTVAMAYAPALEEKETVEYASVILSDDLQQLTINGVSYVRCNTGRLSSENSADDLLKVELSEEQKKNITYVRAWKESEEICSLSVNYKDGAELYVGFLREDLLDEYQQLQTTDSCQVDFFYPEENIIDFSVESARGTEEILFDVYRYNRFTVSAADAEGLTLSRGSLLISDEEYYYVDFEEAGTNNLSSLERFPAWRITDQKLCADIDKAMEEYYGSDLGILEDEDFTDLFSTAFLIVVFMVLPFVILVLFFILALRAKTPVYKKLFWAICVWAALVLTVAGTVCAVVQLG